MTARDHIHCWTRLGLSTQKQWGVWRGALIAFIYFLVNHAHLLQDELEALHPSLIRKVVKAAIGQGYPESGFSPVENTSIRYWPLPRMQFQQQAILFACIMRLESLICPATWADG